MDASAIAGLNRRRNLWRAFLLACVGMEAVALACLFKGSRTLGVALGLVGLIGSAVIKWLGRRSFGEGCAELQTVLSLGLSEPQYQSRGSMSVQALRDAGLVPASFLLEKPLCLHAVTGEKRGQRIELCELTFGCRRDEKATRVFNSGILASIAIQKPIPQRTLLLGNAPFRQALSRPDYEANGLRLCPAGGKARGWYAFTQDGEAPSDELLAQWERLCEASGGRIALSITGNSAWAFFDRCFYTGSYSLQTPATQEVLSQNLFAQLDALLAFTERLQ